MLPLTAEAACSPATAAALAGSASLVAPGCRGSSCTAVWERAILSGTTSGTVYRLSCRPESGCHTLCSRPSPSFCLHMGLTSRRGNSQLTRQDNTLLQRPSCVMEYMQRQNQKAVLSCVRAALVPDCAITTSRDQDRAFGRAEKGRAGHKGSVTQAIALNIVCTLHAVTPI